MNLDQTKVKDFYIDKQYLKKDSLVLPGPSIFDIFFKGTKGNLKFPKSGSLILGKSNLDSVRS